MPYIIEKLEETRQIFRIDHGRANNRKAMAIVFRQHWQRRIGFLLAFGQSIRLNGTSRDQWNIMENQRDWSGETSFLSHLFHPRHAHRDFISRGRLNDINEKFGIPWMANFISFPGVLEMRMLPSANIWNVCKSEWRKLLGTCSTTRRALTVVVSWNILLTDLCPRLGENDSLSAL